MIADQTEHDDDATVTLSHEFVHAPKTSATASPDCVSATSRPPTMTSR